MSCMMATTRPSVATCHVRVSVHGLGGVGWTIMTTVCISRTFPLVACKHGFHFFGMKISLCNIQMSHIFAIPSSTRQGSVPSDCIGEGSYLTCHSSSLRGLTIQC